MAKRWLSAILIQALIVGAVVSCGARDQSEYQGGLYFGQGAYLMRFSLRDGSLSVTGHLGDTYIREVGALGPDHLLIAESASVNGRRVPRISWFDLKTGESADLYAGVIAQFLAAAGVVVYDDGTELFAVPQTAGSANEVIFSHPRAQVVRLAGSGPGLLLFEVDQSGERTIHAWNAVSGELRELDGLTSACRLEGAVWISNLERLVCKQRDGLAADAAYVIADLEGGIEASLGLPADKQFAALVYIEDQQALVLQETWRGMLGSRDRHAVWVHDISNGENHRIVDNMNLGRSVVYADY